MQNSSLTILTLKSALNGYELQTTRLLGGPSGGLIKASLMGEPHQRLVSPGLDRLQSLVGATGDLVRFGLHMAFLHESHADAKVLLGGLLVFLHQS